MCSRQEREETKRDGRLCGRNLYLRRVERWRVGKEQTIMLRMKGFQYQKKERE